MHDIGKVKLFCKRTKIVGVSLSDLFDAVCKKHAMTRGTFEVAMLRLNKKPALDLKSRCLKYFQDEGDHAYEKFCKEQTYVTEAFWVVATGNKPPEIVPENCPSVEKTDKTVPDRKQEKKNITSVDVLENFLKEQKKPESKSESSTVQYLERIEEVKKILSPIKNEPENLHKMLPVNWEIMSFSERVEFVRRIQQDKFRTYVFNLDSKLKKYFSDLKPRAPKVKMYVTVFQFPTNSYSVESKHLLKAFVEVLNTYGRANLQYVECTKPNVVEIREVR
jgi:hypothetical protein